jgi:hypothetical protein
MSNHRDQRSNKSHQDSSSTQGGRGRQAGGSTGGSHRDEKVSSHEQAAFHHETAAHHHQQAAKHATAGNHGRSGLHAEAAHGHGRRATEHGAQAMQRGGHSDADREINRHTLSQNDDRDGHSGGRDDDRDPAGEDDKASSSGRFGLTQRGEGAAGSEEVPSHRAAGRGEGDDSEKQPDDHDEQRPLNGQRRTEGRHQESSRRNS